jgi:hypothetical protein
VEKPKVTRNTSELLNKIQIGQSLSIEITNIHRDRFSTRLIGMLNPKFLILELPSIVKRGELMDRLLYNNTLVIRTICEGSTGECLGFQSRVDSIIKHPHPLVFIDFPLEIITHELRSEERLETFLPAKLYKDDQSLVVPGTITDISNGGCRLVLDNEELLAGFNNTKTMHMSYEDSVRGIEVVKFVRICSQRKKGKHGVALGLAFIEALQMSA